MSCNDCSFPSRFSRCFTGRNLLRWVSPLVALVALTGGRQAEASQVRVPIDSATSSMNLQLCANPGGLGTDCDDETRPVTGFMTVALDNNGNPSTITLRNFDLQAMGDYTLGLSWLFGAARVDGTVSNLRVQHGRPGPT